MCNVGKDKRGERNMVVKGARLVKVHNYCTWELKPTNMGLLEFYKTEIVFPGQKMNLMDYFIDWYFIFTLNWVSWFYNGRAIVVFTRISFPPDYQFIFLYTFSWAFRYTNYTKLNIYEI